MEAGLQIRRCRRDACKALYSRNAVGSYLHAKGQRWSRQAPRKGRSLYEAYAQMLQHAAARKCVQLRLVHDCKWGLHSHRMMLGRAVICLTLFVVGLAEVAGYLQSRGPL